MEMADASWWGSEDEFQNDIDARLKSDDPAVREEARKLKIALNARRGQGSNPFNSAPPAPQNRQEAPQRAIRGPMHMDAYSHSPATRAGFIEQLGPAAQGEHLQDMVKDVTNAYQDENDSRVAQLREQRRMDHEMNLAGMQYDALLQRLAMEQESKDKDRLLQKQLMGGTVTRRFNPDTLSWEEM
jgi:hypothetical protein